MKFEEIFNEDGLYTSNDFVEGFCFEISNGSLYGVQYRSVNDFIPEKDHFHTYKGLFIKDYRKVFTIKSLFKVST
jgi:hypothetical protein